MEFSNYRRHAPKPLF
uniref:Uncharacterized protein n=1 Tax=Anguilla anguilla TaxID=7936 RepID=A0A0E9TLZ6_ANGAN